MRRFWKRVQTFGQRLSPIPLDTSLVFGLVLLASLVFAAVIATRLEQTYTQVTIGEKADTVAAEPTIDVAGGDSGDWSIAWIIGLYVVTAIVGVAAAVIVARQLRRRLAQWRTRCRLRAVTAPDEVQVSLARLAEAQSATWGEPPAAERTTTEPASSLDVNGLANKSNSN